MNFEKFYESKEDEVDCGVYKQSFVEKYRVLSFPDGFIAVDFDKDSKGYNDAGYPRFSINFGIDGIVNGEEIFNKLKKYILEELL